MFPSVIETERLRLKRLTEAVDPLEVYEYYAKSETIAEETKYMSWDPHQTLKETWDTFKTFEERWNDAEDAVYGIFPRESEEGAGEFAGTAGLHPDWEKRTGNLGIWLRKPFWGRGYSGERAGALMQLAFDRLDLELVAVGYLPANTQSQRAIEKYMEKYGGRYEGCLRNWLPEDDGVKDMHRYSVSQAEWREAVGDEREASFSE